MNNLKLIFFVTSYTSTITACCVTHFIVPDFDEQAKIEIIVLTFILSYYLQHRCATQPKCNRINSAGIKKKLEILLSRKINFKG